MFGILLSLLSATIAGTDYAVKSHQAKQRGWERMRNGENPDGTYYDIHGNCRDLVTGEVKNITWKNGHVVQTDQYGRVTRDITLEREEAAFQEAKKNAAPGATVVPFESHGVNRNNSKEYWYRTPILQDIKTGQHMAKMKLTSRILRDGIDVGVCKTLSEESIEGLKKYEPLYVYVSMGGFIVRIADEQKDSISDQSWFRVFKDEFNRYVSCEKASNKKFANPTLHRYELKDLYR